MSQTGAIYAANRADIGRMALCGLPWSILDQLLDETEATTPAAFGLACERRADRLAGVEPGTAAMLYHFAQIKEVNDLARKCQLQARSRSEFWAGPPRWGNRHVTRVEVVEWDRTLPAIVVENPGCPRSATPLILFNGLDSAKEVELAAFADRFLGHGIDRCVLIDGPGQGEARWERGIFMRRIETVIPATLRTLRETGRAVSRADVFGVSFGGFLALKLAQTVPEIRATVCFSGATDWDHLAGLPPRLTSLFQQAVGHGPGASWESFLRSELRLAATSPIRPVLIAHGTHDSIMPIAASRRLAESYPDQLTLWEIDDGHVFLHHIDDVVSRAATWLASRANGVHRVFNHQECCDE